MIFSPAIVLVLSLVGSIGALPSGSQDGTDVRSTRYIRRPTSLAKADLAFSAFVQIDLVNDRPIAVPEGTRFNIAILGGNWTNPDGSLLAIVVGGVGGEFGFIDHNNVFNLIAQYTVQFPVDKAYGYVQLQGAGFFGQANELFVTIESNSTAAKGLVARTLYAPGVLIDTFLAAPHYLLSGGGF